MAQDITLLGVDYADVPAVELPKTGGGTASFTDVTDTTAVAADVAQGKVFYLADGSQATGTSSGGGGGDGSVSESDVNFYDYDGTLLYSYSAEDFAALKELPENPMHDGMESQGWNWTKAQIEARLASTPGHQIPVGQIIETVGGAVRITCLLEAGQLSPYLGVCVDGTFDIDWGDGSEHDSLTGTSNTSAIYISHIYSAPGVYVIAISPTADTDKMGFTGASNTSNILKKETGTTANINKAYTAAIQKIETGRITRIDQYILNYLVNLETINFGLVATKVSNYCCQNAWGLKAITMATRFTQIGNYAFAYDYSLRTVSLPPTITSIGTYAFRACYALKNITIPDSVTSMGNYAFTSCYSLKSASLPSGLSTIPQSCFSDCRSLTQLYIAEGVKAIGSSAFQSCYAIPSVTIPSTVTSIGGAAFSGCYCLGEIHFKSATPPKVSGSTAWTGIPTDCKIYVPAGTLEAYTTATNYPSSSTYTYIEE